MATYKKEIIRLCRFLIPKHSRVLELGCGAGDLLASVDPIQGLGIDPSGEEVAAARERYGHRQELRFETGDVESVHSLPGNEAPFDYILLSDLVPVLKDVQTALSNLQPVCARHTRLILNFHSNLWRPILSLATWLRLRKPIPDYNWLSTKDIQNLLHLAGFEPICGSGRILLPLGIPLVAAFFNRFLAKLPLIRHLCLSQYIIARPMPSVFPIPTEKPSVSILVPTRNEKGNIEDLFKRTPPMGAWTELVFVDGHSEDGTVEEIERCSKAYGPSWRDVVLIPQTGKGKGQAVRQGMDQCKGDILMILDSDLTMPPEELPKYYEAICQGKGEFINGCRLVYPQEQKAMRFLNMLANHCFAALFTWLLNQRIKDTLCGTKVFWRSDYEHIAANRSYFGDFDPFGDFDLLFGAVRLSRKIVDLPIRYRERTYGAIKINRWRDGLLLLRMSLIAFLRFKLS